MQDKISLALPEDGKRKWEAGENRQGGGRKPNINKVSQLWLFSIHIVGRKMARGMAFHPAGGKAIECSTAKIKFKPDKVWLSILVDFSPERRELNI